MKLVAMVAAMAMLLMPILSLGVEPVDPLWAKTVALSQLAKKWVAKDIETLSTAAKNGDPVTTATVQSHLSGWEKDQPVYTELQTDPAPDASNRKGPPKMAEMMKAVVGMQDKLLLLEAKVTRTDGQKLHGKTWTLFQTAGGGTGQTMAARIWVDPQTGCIHQSDTDVHVIMALDAHMKSAYEFDVQGRCMAKQIDADIEILVPFKGAKIKLKQTSANWIERPVASVP